jgi:hypothetical protein
MKYKIQKRELRAIINKYDPENLIEGGAPEDEYDAYLDRILSLFYSNQLTEATLKQVFRSAPRALDYKIVLDDIRKVLDKK